MNDDVIKNVLDFIENNFVVLGVAGHDIEPGTYVTVENGKVIACMQDDAIGYAVDRVGPGCRMALDLSCGHIFDAEDPAV